MNGENASYRIYDMLEQDFVNIYLNAKYLFYPFVTEIPELFGGTFRGSIQAHSFLQIIMYKFVQGVHFLNLNQILMQFVGYSGMYLLTNKIYHTEESKIKSFINAGASFLFCITPLLLHGMTIMAMPLFGWMLIKIYESKTKKDLLLIYALSIFIGLGTSLVYCGFMFLVIPFGLGIYFLIKKRKNLALKYFIAMLIIFGGYFVTYFYSFLSLGEVSHRLEMAIPKQKFFPSIIRQLMYEVYAIESPIYPVITFALFTLATLIVLKQNKINKEYKYTMYCFWVIILIVLFSAGYTSLTLILKIRAHYSGVLQSLQWDRMAYSVSPLYSFMFTSVLLFFYEKFKNYKFPQKYFLILLTLIFIWQFYIIVNDDKNYFKENIKTIRGIQTPERTYAQFFQTDLMNEIKDYIDKPQNSYHVVSFGINPGVPLFNGFYCLDGYSVNYRLSYKKQWREIINGELKKSKSLSYLFEKWGSRVYIAHHSTGTLRPAEMYDKGKSIDKLYIDYQKLKELGADYLFSKYEIKEPNPYIKLEKVFYSKLDNGDKDFQVFLYSFN